MAGAHGLKIEPCPSEAELLLFQSSFGIVDDNFELDLVIQHAVNKAFHNKSRRLWCLGDQVQIVEGVFVDTTCSICEIDKDNQSIIVKFNLPMLTCMQVGLGDLEWQFLIGDKVCVTLGENKGRMGSVVEINDSVSTIIKQMANEVIEVNLTLYSSSFITHFTQFKSPLLYLESHNLAPSFAITPHPAASLMSKPMPFRKPEALKGHQMLGRCDLQIEREAAVYVGHMKGYQARLVDIS